MGDNWVENLAVSSLESWETDEGQVRIKWLIGRQGDILGWVTGLTLDFRNRSLPFWSTIVLIDVEAMGVWALHDLLWLPPCPLQNEKKTVKMMNQRGRFRIGFIEELQAQILEMKYTMGKLSMLVLLPSCSEDNVKSLQEVQRHCHIHSHSTSLRSSTSIPHPRRMLSQSVDIRDMWNLKEIGYSFFTCFNTMSKCQKCQNKRFAPQIHRFL